MRTQAPAGADGPTSLGGPARRLYLCDDAARIRRQLTALPDGRSLTLAEAGALRDDLSTDEIAPLPALVHFDATLGRHAHTGTTARGDGSDRPDRLVRPFARDALAASGARVLVAGHRYGKGSSREHAPLAELSAGIRLVFARSFERIYRQNADNLGLLTCTDFELLARLEQGQTLTLDDLLAGREPQSAAILRAGGLLAHGLGPAGEAVTGDDEDGPGIDPGPLTLFEKIVRRHAPHPRRSGFVRADRRFIHEIYTGMAAHLLAQHFGDDVPLHDRDSIVCFEDHLSFVHRSPTHLAQGLVPDVRRLSDAHRAFVARHGLRDHGVLQGGEGSEGISHALMAERYACPGELIVGTDSHTPHSGALGCVAFGVGTTEMANAFVTGAVRLRLPEVLRVEIDGSLPPGVSAKDLALHLLALPELRAGAGVGRVFEFGGAAVRAMGTDDRATLTNMTAEMGGFTGLVEPDAETVRFIRERRGQPVAIEPWMCSDPGARYAAVIRVDAGGLAPMVARPGDPGHGLPLSAWPMDERPPIHIAYGGSCTAGKREDFAQVHQVLAWAAARGRRVAPGVRLYLQFGTQDVRAHGQAQGWVDTFGAVGAEILLPACGACAQCGPGTSTSPDEVTVSAVNRNFPGRNGPGPVWLASPATVAASAIAGRLVSFEELLAMSPGD